MLTPWPYCRFCGLGLFCRTCIYRLLPEYAEQRRSIMYLYVYSAAAAAAAVLLYCCRCCCCLLTLFVIVYLPPEVALHTIHTAVVFLASTVTLFFNTNENTFSIPLGSTINLCRLVLPTSYLSWPLRACAEPQAGVIPPRLSPPCINRSARRGEAPLV